MLAEIVEHENGWTSVIIDELTGNRSADRHTHDSRSACIAAALRKAPFGPVRFVDRIDPILP